MKATVEKTKTDIVAMLARVGVTSPITFTEEENIFTTSKFYIEGREITISVGKKDARMMVHSIKDGRRSGPDSLGNWVDVGAYLELEKIESALRMLKPIAPTLDAEITRFKGKVKLEGNFPIKPDQIVIDKDKIYIKESNTGSVGAGKKDDYIRIPK